MPLKRSIIPVLLVSLGLFAGIAMLPTGAQGQPQEKDKAKQKAKQTAVRTVTIATGLWHPWSLAWLPNGDMLVTERNGKLRTVRDGKLDADPVAGVPAVHSVRLSGLMEVLPHPNFAQNHFVYLTYTKDVPEKGEGMVATTLARGRLEGRQLVDVKDILICDSWAGDGGSGSRLAWGKDGMLYMTTGASNGNAAQEGTSLRGKILRLKDDGTAAPGNPFAGKAGYKAEIYSMGHRNSLGLAFNPVTGDLWNNENGPYGGDEINIIKPGGNYGWPKVSYGRDYSGPQIVNFSARHDRAHRVLGAVHRSFGNDVLHRRASSRTGRTTYSWARSWAAPFQAIRTWSGSCSTRNGTRPRASPCSSI